MYGPNNLDDEPEPIRERFYQLLGKLGRSEEMHAPELAWLERKLRDRCAAFSGHFGHEWYRARLVQVCSLIGKQVDTTGDADLDERLGWAVKARKTDPA
jgi:hypothetical protein